MSKIIRELFPKIGVLGNAAILFALLVLSFAARPCFAQDNYTRFELGAQFSTIRETPPGGGGKNYPGFGGRFDWNLTRRLALEGELDYFPGHAESQFLLQGGRTVQAVFGIRAKVIQTRKLSVFGLVRPGVFHFTDVLTYQTNPDGTYQTKAPNYFELNLGGGIEYYASPRWVLRAEITGNPNRVSNEENVPNGSGGTSLAIGKIGDTTRLSFGVAYRPGELKENEAETKVSGNWEFGPLFGTVMSVREGADNGVKTDPAVGGYASYRFYKVFYLDSDILYFPVNHSTGGPHDGGEILQGLFGVKGGIRRNHFGFFGKVRPGFNSYSAAVTSLTTTTGGSTDYTYGRSTNVVLDLGGIVEFYPNEHGTLRIEAGDTHIFYGTKTVEENGAPFVYPGGGLKHSIQLVVGYGWRF